jgi:Tfp pilus assembly protein PilO
MQSSGRLVASVLVVVAVAIAFWLLVLGPKREQAAELGTQIEGLHGAVEEANARATQAAAAQQQFPADYRQLVVLGKAVPTSDETSSLLVELNHIADRSGVRFNSIQLTASAGSVPEPAPTTTAPPAESSSTESSGAVSAAASIPPTEAAAAAVPLGATVGSAGLAVMPYTINLSGDFFHVADFIKHIDSLVHTGNVNVEVDGRLLTLNSFALTADGAAGFPQLDGSFSVTTYLTPASQGLTAGATPTEPAEASETTAAQ